MSHDPFSPWPQHGKWFRFERFAAYRIVANFGDETDKTFSATWGRWWFFSFAIGKMLHGYIGHKPINLMDQHFRVPEGFDRSVAAVEWSGRFGVGGVS